MDESKDLKPVDSPQAGKVNLSYNLAAQAFLSRCKKKYTPSSLEILRQRLNHWPKLLRRSSSLPCEEILSEKNIKKGLKKLHRDNRSPHTISNYLSVVLRLRKLIFPRQAIALDTMMPAQDVITSYGRRLRFKVGEEPDLSLIDPWDVRLACILAYEEALLPSEILGLSRGDFRNGYVHCGRRNRKRKIPYGPILENFLKRNPHFITLGLVPETFYRYIRRWLVTLDDGAMAFQNSTEYGLRQGPNEGSTVYQRSTKIWLTASSD